MAVLVQPLMPWSTGSSGALYVCPVCPWTLQVDTLFLVEYTDEVDRALLDHFTDPGCHWKSEELMIQHGRHASGSIAHKLCTDRRKNHDRALEKYLDGSWTAKEWWL